MTQPIPWTFEPADVWRYFAEVCSIPHPSGHEAALARRVAALAAEHGLACRQDAAGNVRIDRPAAPGFGRRPRIILQAHLDMVPQAAAGRPFDFESQPIRPVVRGGWVSADGTTLGADDGIGVALALALLFDARLKAGPLAGVFTVSEETGLVGARAIDPAFLKGDWLLNLDGGGEGRFCIGCAGSGRLEVTFDTAPDPVGPGRGAAVAVAGLRGGHSGSHIHERRGNALVFLVRFLLAEPSFRIGAIEGGSVDNAIPREAAALGIAGEPLAAMRRRADRLAAALAGEFEAPKTFTITVSDAPRPATAWNRAFQGSLLKAVAAAPNGVQAYSDAFRCVRTSSNLAAMHSSGGRLTIRTSQRSLDDGERAALTGRIAAGFAAAGGTPKTGNVYPAWKPRPDSPLLRRAGDLYKTLTGGEAGWDVIHAGLEAGLFCRLNPGLDILALTPTLKDIHSPGERLEIASVQRVHRFLRALLERGPADQEAASRARASRAASRPG